MTTASTQVVVLGGGPGGYAAAFRAADLGLRTTLVDLEPNPGGVCLYRGCIPSKALLHIAKVLHDARAAARWGVHFEEPRIDLDAVRAWKNRVVEQLTGGVGQLAKAREVTYVQGRGVFHDAHTLRVTMDGGGDTDLPFEHAIVATGSRPAVIPSLALESPRMWDSTSALELECIPATLLVIGGGYIGLEMATVYAALGSQVTVVEMTKSLLPGADRDLVKTLTKAVQQQVHQVLLQSTVTDLREIADGIQVRFEGAKAPEGPHVFARVLVSVGRTPNAEGLGLEQTQVRVTERGFIEVDAQRRTAEPSIFAIGDVAGNPMLAHKATHEGLIAAEAIAGQKVAFEPQAIPAVVFTDPEVAWCGLMETDAKAAGRKVKVARFPWSASGRAVTLDRVDGLTKLVLDPDSGTVLGVGIVGPGAGDLIAEGVLAVEMGASAQDLALTIHAHPTLSESIMEAAEVFLGQSVHLITRRL